MAKIKKNSPRKKSSKPKTTAKFKKRNNKKKNREITGLFLIFFGVLSVISLISMFNIFGERITSSNFAVYPFNNILGTFGDFFLFIFVNTFGSKLSFIVAFGIIILGYNLIRGKEKKLLIFRSIFISTVIFFFSIIFSISSMNPLQNISYVDSGGVLGHIVINYIFKPFFQTETFGPYMIMGFIVLIWIVIGTPLSFNELFGRFEVKFIKFLQKLKNRLHTLYINIREKGENIGIKIVKKETKIKPNLTELPHKKKSSSNNFFNSDNLESEIDKLKNIFDKMDEKRNPEKKSSNSNNTKIVTEESEIIDAEIIENINSNIDKKSDDKSQYNIHINLEDDKEKNESITIKDINGVDVDNFKVKKDYTLPPVDLLGLKIVEKNISEDELRENGIKLLEKLKNFKVTGSIIKIIPGPVITRYEIRLDAHIQVSKVAKFANDLAMALEAQSIIIQAPIPGKNAIGIDVPNPSREIVYFRELLESKEFKENKFILPFAIGQNVDGTNIVTGLEKMPHLLIAGQTGAGKSVGLNTIIVSLLYSQTPEQCKLILIDPKKVEFTIFKDIPHLLTPVITEAEDALAALNWITAEMDDRYRILSKVGVRNIEGYNIKAKNKDFPLSPEIPEKYWKNMNYIVLIVDELADLMMLAGKEVEAAIQRIAQLARAVGIHLIVATQRPSVNVITGVIKANLPSRIAFKTPTVIDSRTILDTGGAEKLLGMGDMLFYKTGALAGAERIHGAFITDSEAENIAKFVSQQKKEDDEPITIPDKYKKKDGSSENKGNLDNTDDKLKDAAKLAIEQGELSTTFLQRRLSVGFARAGKMVDELELLGIVGPKNGSKAREVLVGSDYMESEEWIQFFG